MSYVGAATRAYVNINYKKWVDVPESIKDNLWNDIQALGESNRKRIRSNAYPHVMSRGGYAKLNKRLYKQKLEQLQTTSDEGSIIDTLQLVIARDELWVEGRKKKYGTFTMAG